MRFAVNRILQCWLVAPAIIFDFAFQKSYKNTIGYKMLEAQWEMENKNDNEKK